MGSYHMKSTLTRTAKNKNVNKLLTRSQALQLDDEDALKSFRNRFFIPEHNGKPVAYMVGNSLGLQSKTVKQVLDNELDKWQNLGVEAWFEGTEPWIPYLNYLKNPLAAIVGATEQEVTIMNSATTNIHLMLASFYQPAGKKSKILTEGGAFPSDQYAFETHLKLRGFDPDATVVEIFPREGEFTLRTEDIIQKIAEIGEELALVLMGGINYYTGQLFDIQQIAQQAHAVGALAGFDMAHVVGNVPIQLHDWSVDFAVWCSYKYLNAGPGAVAGVFVHQNHHHTNLPRLAGWWGYDEATRFDMAKGFKPMLGADGWQVSTPNILSMACHRASLAIFEEAGMESLRQKSIALTAYLEEIILQYPEIQIITPSEPSARGAQLSLLVAQDGKQLFEHLKQANIWGDWREPNCIRLAPAPLYNTFEEVWQVGEALKAFYR